MRSAVLFAARLRRLQVVTRSDSNIYAVAGEHSLKRSVRRTIMRIAFPSWTRVWTVGKANEGFWRDYVGRTNTHLIPYSTPRLPDSMSLEPTRRRSDPARLRFLFVGRLVPGKAVDVLLRAFMGLRGEEYQQWSLTIVGHGPEREGLQAAASGNSRVRFAGSAEYRDLDQFYREADVLVLPSQREAWGLVVNEALAFGLWVVCSDAVGARELLTSPERGATFRAGATDELRDTLKAATGFLDRVPRPPSDPSDAMAADLNRMLARSSHGH